MRIFFLPILLITTLLVTSCGSPNGHTLKGHYEEFSKTQADAYRGRQAVVPEYEPSQAVIVSMALLSTYNKESFIKEFISAGARDIFVTIDQGSRLTLSSSAFNELRTLLGHDFQRIHLTEVRDRGAITVWARDWSPLGAEANDTFDPSKKLRFLDLNYYPYRPADDSSPRALENLYAYSRISVPVYNEGGNFMVNDSGECLMTTRVVDANNSKSRPDDMILSAQEIKTYYKEFAGCKNVTIFNRIPYERTGHIDMWAKFLSDKKVIVGQLKTDTLNLLSGSTLSTAKIIAEYLNDRAGELESAGYNVIRIPMPAPESGVFRSYTNSLFLNGTVLVPRYRKPSYKMLGKYPDSSLLASYEKEVTSIYQDAGYKVVFLDSDNLIANGGAIHCVTMQVPQFPYASPR